MFRSLGCSSPNTFSPSCIGSNSGAQFASSVLKGCKSGFVTYWHHVVQQAKLQLIVKYYFWLAMFYPTKICSSILCLYKGYWYTKQLLAFNPLISNPYLHPFGTKETNCSSIFFSKPNGRYDIFKLLDKLGLVRSLNYIVTILLSWSSVSLFD